MNSRIAYVSAHALQWKYCMAVLNESIEYYTVSCNNQKGLQEIVR